MTHMSVTRLLGLYTYHSPLEGFSLNGVTPDGMVC